MHKPAGRAAGPWRAAAIAAVAAAALALGGAQESLGTTVSPTMTAEQVRDAIEAKPDDGTVTFNEGTYEGLGNVAIRNDITLQPASGADVVLNGTVSLNILSDGVTIQGLTFENIRSPGTGPDYIGYTSNRYTGVIVLGFNQDAFPVTASNAGTTLDGILIRGNTIEEAQCNGILFRPYNADNRVTYSNIEIDDNTINRMGTCVSSGTNSEQAGAIHGGERDARPAAINGLTITDNQITLPRKTGIDVAEVSSGTITGNTIDRANSFSIRIAGASDGVTVSGNTATRLFGNLSPQGEGVSVDARAQNTVIRENTLQRMTSGVKVCDTAGTGCGVGDAAPSATLTVTENSFLGNNVDVENANSAAGTLGAEGNYFDGLPGTPLRASNVDLFPYYTEPSREIGSLTQEVRIGGDAAGELLTEQAGAYTRNYTGSVAASDSILGMTLIVNLTHADPSGELLVGIESPDGTFVELPPPASRFSSPSTPLVYSTSTRNFGADMQTYADTLNTLIGTDPSGTWKVALQDRAEDGDTTPVYDWSLSMALEPSAAALAAVDDEASTGQNNAVTIPILDNDNGVAGASNVAVTVPTQTANGGTPTVTGTSPDFSVSYAPRAGFSGVDTFEYTLSADGSDPRSATVTVNVGAFYIRDLADQVTNEFVEVSYQIPVANPDGLDLSWGIASQTADASSTISPAGVFEWTPSEADGDGVPREFVIEATGTSADYGQETHRKTLRATANEVNSAPMFNLDDEYEASRGVPFTLDVTATDRDLPEQPLRYVLTPRTPGQGAEDAPRIDVHQNASLGNYHETPISPDGTVTMTWPVPVVGDGNHTIELIVSDQQSPPLEDRHTFHIIVPDRSADIGVTNVDLDTVTVVTTGLYGSNYDVRVLYPNGTELHSSPNLADAVPAASAQLDLVQEGIYTIQTDTRGGANQWNRDSTVTAVFEHPGDHRTQYAESVAASDPPERKIEPFETVTIDVAPHVRTDPLGLPFSVEVTSDPEMGTARAVNQTIEYTAADVDMLREDTIGYTVYVGSTIHDTSNATVRTTVLAAPDISRSTAPNFRISMPLLNDLPDGTVLSLPGLPAPHPNGTVSHPNGRFEFSDTGMTFVPDTRYSGTVEVEYAVARGGATETGTATMHFYLPEVRLDELDDPYLTQRGKSFLIDINNTRPDVWVPSDLEWEIKDTIGDGEFEIDANTGVTTWTPANETGVQTIIIEVAIAGLEGPDYPSYVIRTIPYDDVGFGVIQLQTPGNLEPVMYDVPIVNPDAVPVRWSLAEAQQDDEEIDAETGRFTWTPKGADNNTAREFQVRYSVGNGTAVAVPADAETATLRVEVGVQNHKPTIGNLMDEPVDEGALVGIDPVVTDADDDAHTWRLTGDDLPGCLVSDVADPACFDPDTGALAWQTGEMDDGTYVVTFHVDDMGGAGGQIIRSDNVTVTITVREVPQDPVAPDHQHAVMEDPEEPLVIMPDISDADYHEGRQDVASISSVIATEGTVNHNGTHITYRPPDNWSGSATVTYTVMDEGSRSATGMIGIAVTPVNDPPVLAGIAPVTVDEGSPVVINVSATDPDVADGDTLTYSFDSSVLPANADFAFDAAVGALVWNTTEADDGIHTLTFSVRDADGAMDTKNATVTVNEIIDFALDADGPAGRISAVWGDPASSETTIVLTASGSCIGTDGMDVRGVAIRAEPWTDGASTYGGITTRAAAMAGNVTLGPLLVPTGAEGETNPAVFRLDAPPAGGRIVVTLYADLAGEQARAAADLLQRISYKAFCY